MRDAVLLGLGLATLSGLIFVHLQLRKQGRLPALVAYFDLVVGGLVAMAAWQGATFEAWMQEDAWAEWATVYAFGLAAALHLLRLKRWRAPPEGPGWLAPLGVLLVAMFCVFVAGEEVSWGQRLFAFQPPEIFLEQNFQQELNVHNLLTGKQIAGFSLDSRFLVALVAIVFGAVLPGLRWWAPVRALQPALESTAPAWELSPWFLAVALAELSYPAELGGEACELVLGLLFVAAALVPGSAGAPGPVGTRRVLVALVAPLVVGVVTPVLITVLVYGSDQARVAQANAELRLLRDDLAVKGVIQPKLRSKRRVHKRVFTAVQAGYFDFSGGLTYLEGGDTPATPDAADPRRDRQGYFLDPWNNPYWVVATRRSRTGLLYSFGPNRRRDTKIPKNRVSEGFEAAGDDIVVTFSLVASAAD